MTAPDQIANPLKKAKRAIPSQCLMKGMDGEANVNNDNEITASELHE